MRVGMLDKGDLSWPPSGEGVFSSGNLMGPKGETPSCSLSQEPSVGAFGGLDGFHGTVVVLRVGGEDCSAVGTLGNSENDAWEASVGGSFLVSLYFVDVLDAAIVVPT